LVAATTLARLVPQLTLGVDFSIHHLSPFQHLLVGWKSTLVTSSGVCAYFAVKHLPL
jgi:hypothetical protein